MRLVQEELDELRAKVREIKARLDLSWDEIETEIGVTDKAVWRFVVEGSKPNRAYRMKLSAWADKYWKNKPSPTTETIKRLAETTLSEVRRIWSAYSGFWVGLNLAAGCCFCKRLIIFPQPGNFDAENYPVPRFILDLGPGLEGLADAKRRSFPIAGYIQLRNNELHFVGRTTWPPSSRIGLMVMSDVEMRQQAQVMGGWSLLPTVSTQPMTPTFLAFARVDEATFDDLLVGPHSLESASARIPHFDLMKTMIEASAQSRY